MPRAFIRHGQPGITSVLPHQGNAVYAIPRSAGGVDPFAPITYGYNFNGAAGAGPVVSQLVTGNDAPITGSFKFVNDALPGATKIVLTNSNGSLRIRHLGSSNAIEITTFAIAVGFGGAFAVAQGVPYRFDFTIETNGDVTGTLYDITNKTQVGPLTQSIAPGSNVDSVITVGSNSAGTGANWDGILSDMRFSNAPPEVSDGVPFDDGAGTTARNTVRPTNFLSGIEPGVNGAWFQI